jgi:hypothetical protein
MDYIRMAMSRYIIDWHMLGIFKPQIRAILGVDSNAAIFADLSTTLMCICVGKCATFGGFSTNCTSSMTIN